MPQANLYAQARNKMKRIGRKVTTRKRTIRRTKKSLDIEGSVQSTKLRDFSKKSAMTSIH